MNRFSLICFLIVVAAVAPLFHPLARESVQDREQNVRQRPSSNALNGKRIAVVIGNGKYSEVPLANPANDAREIAKTLRELGFEVVELTDQNKTQMKQAIRAFGDKLDSGEGNVALFYFAGHGSQVNGRNYLIPIGADVTNEAEAEDECVNLELVLAQIKRSRKGLNIIVLDACRNNPFRGWRSAEGGLSYVNAPRGTLIAYATAPGRTAADGRGKNSPYTSALLNHLRVPNTNLLKMFENVRAEVELVTNGNQTPWESTSVTNGSDFYMAGKTDDPRTLELGYWNLINASRNAADFRAYLMKYPNGEFKTLAENRIAEIERETHSPTQQGDQSDQFRGNLTIQSGSWPDQKEANDRAAKLKSAGIDARIYRADIPGKGSWFRIQIGSFPSRDEAMAYGNQLRTRGLIQDFIVVTSGRP